MNPHYHFIGIGGIGMGAIALLLAEKGFKVTGSDLRETQMTTQLKALGAHIFIGHQAEHIEGADYIIYSSAITDVNPELKAAHQKKITILKRAELLADLMKEQTGITIAGAHGKTTTTSMVSSLLLKAHLKPTIAVGGIVNTLGINAQLGGGKYFVAEVDESDGSFLYFSPKFSIITNIDHEHLDYYGNWDNIVKAYSVFINRTASDGMVIACGEDQNLINLIKETKRPYQTYGFSQQCDVYAKNIRFQQFKTLFDCYHHDQYLGQISLAIPGQHNVANAMASILLGINLSIDIKIIAQSLNEFRGVQRRFQIIGHTRDILVIDDYAHHPTEIAATLKAAEPIRKKRLVAVFQPHRFSRVKFLAKEFIESLSHCDYLILTDIYAANENPIDGISSEQLVQELKKKRSKPVVYLKKGHVIEHLIKEVQPGDVVMMLGAGDITHLGQDFVAALKNSTPIENKV